MEGKLCIFRKSTVVESYELNGDSYSFVRPASHFIFALTDNGRIDGHPVDWGCLRILNRLRSSDLHQRDIAEDTIKEIEANEKTYRRDLGNNLESFLYDFRDQFKDTFKDVNTQSLAKKDLRRDREKRIKE
jgi:hypothetical protein